MLESHIINKRKFVHKEKFLKEKRNLILSVLSNNIYTRLECKTSIFMLGNEKSLGVFFEIYLWTQISK